jgi:acyl carrier protein
MNFYELEPIIKKAFPDEETISQQMTKNDLASWDSIGHLNLILEVEDELGFSFTKEEIEEIDTINKLLFLVNSKIVK